MTNRIFVIVFILFILMGGTFSYYLANIENLKTFKVLNVVGLLYDILGLVVLSEILSSSEKYQEFISNTFSGLFMWAHMGIPIGVVGGGFAFMLIGGYPSAKLATSIGAGSLVWMMIPMFVVESVVFMPTLGRIPTARGRARFFGGFLLLSGLFVQFVAALKDLNS